MNKFITIRGVTIPLIPAEDVPPRKTRSNWAKIFGSIPEGKALVLERGVEINYLETSRQALYRLQKQGKFLNLLAIQSGNKIYFYWERNSI